MIRFYRHDTHIPYTYIHVINEFLCRQVDHLVKTERATSSPGPYQLGAPNSSVIDQLKYENDRLKIALAQRSVKIID